MNFEKELNEKQYEAVSSSYRHLRIIAGAGSGKTRVLTYRIAYLISEMGVEPWNILAITFTNKVANEMKSRVVKMIPSAVSSLTIRTFHSFAAYFLRKEIGVLDFPATFTILDEDDQKKLIKDIASQMNYKKGDKIVNQTLNYIGLCKLNEKYPDDIKIVKPRFEEEEECLEIYKRYEEEKNKMFCLDFDDLLLKANEILEKFPEIRIKWQNRINHILIDEFQDTNNTQYKLVKYLLRPDTCLYVVGDPDQTIYTWRGANHKIILDLNKDLPDIETIILNRNYRSTQNILNSANKLIAYNKMRIHKDLYTEEEIGDKIIVHSSPSPYSEAEYVAREIMKMVQSGKAKYSDFAILYRSSYITKDFENCFIQYRIPYQIYGGLKFYQRKEIKDVLAYFRLVVNTKDNVSFKRIINVPRRGIGEIIENRIYMSAENLNMSIYDYLKNCDEQNSVVSPKILNSLKSMIFTIDVARRDINKNEEVFSKILEDMIRSLGYFDYLKDDEDYDERVQNVMTLFEDIRHYMKAYPDSTFDEYLQNITLASAQDDIIDGDYVSMMTVHTAKGLEFPIVFVVRLNDSVFPHIRSVTESGFMGLEEERRLAYVAFTRAKKKLYLTYAGGFSYVVSSSLVPSQFLKESGNYVLETPKPIQGSNLRQEKPTNFYEATKPIRQDFNTLNKNDVQWEIGDIVIHKTLGKGVVVDLESDDIIKVDFEEHGIKSILGSHPAVSKGGSDA